MQFSGSLSETFEIPVASNKAASLLQCSFGTFFGLLLKHVLDTTTEGIYFRTRSDDSLFNLARVLGISWLEKVTNADVLSRVGLPSTYILLRQRRLRWLGHVRRMDDGRIPNYILYGELALGTRTTGHPHLRYKDVCVRDMKAVDIDPMSFEGLAADRTKWRSALK